MANMEALNNDLGSLVLDAPIDGYADDVFTAAGADTFLEGTILARDSSTKKLVVFVKGGSTNENGIPKAALVKELTATGAGDLIVRPLVHGVVDQAKLVIHADGDNSNVDAEVLDQLRDYGIRTQDVGEMNIQDNQ